MAATVADMSTRWWRLSLVAVATSAFLLVIAVMLLLGSGKIALEQQVAAAARIGGPFQLTTQDGKSLSDKDLRGSPFVVFFGFTHCPEVCPTTLFEMSEALKTLGDEARSLRMLFVSVDPQRDKPEMMANYLQSFDPRIIGLTGSEQDIEALAKSYRVYWKKIPSDDGGYTMDHTASVYLMDSSGQFTGVIAYGEDQKSRLVKLRRLIRG